MTSMTGRKTSGGGRRVEVEGLNPGVLRWARERAGHSVPEVARKLRKAVDLVERWEAGTAAPTYPELEHLAYDVLHRPLAIFFFPAPPAEATLEKSFRTLPGFEIEKLEPSTRLSIRRAHADQLAMKDLFGGRSPVPNPLLRAVVLPARPDVAAVATSVRQALGVRLEEQMGAWKDEREALARWRAAVEAAGVFVLKTSLEQRSISGFSLFDPGFPVIVLNDRASLARQLFTLMHELGHLLEQTGGVTTADDEFVRALRGEAREIEGFCNRLAAEILVPPDGIRQRVKGVEPSDDSVSAVARTYKISRAREQIGRGRGARRVVEGGGELSRKSEE